MNDPRTQRLEPGVFISFRGATWRVVGLSATTVHLAPYGTDQAPEVWLVAEVLAADDFRILADMQGQVSPETDAHEYADRFTMDVLDAKEQEVVRRRLNLVLLACDGRLPGEPSRPELADLSERQRTIVLADQEGITDRTLRNWIRRFRQSGLPGLVDRRLTGDETPWVVIDAKWRVAFDAVLCESPNRTKVTDKLLVEQVRAEAAARFGDDVPEVSDRQLLRYLSVLDRTRHLSKKSQRSRANAPAGDRRWQPIRAARPGQVVVIDTQRLDAFALDAVSGEWQVVQLLLALDLFSRSIVGWRFTAWEPNAQDVKLLLRSIISPKVADPSWPAEGLWRYTGVPDHVVAGLLHADPLHDQEDTSEMAVAGVPVLVPDEITLDHGKNYISQDVKDGCDLLGITIGLARPYTPTDKAHVERVFGTINHGFVQRLPGYKGPDIHSRGVRKYVEDGAFYTLDEIDTLFAAWVAVEYQNAPHDGLRHPALPGVMLSPNQMVDWAMTTSGFIPVPVDMRLQIELLTTEWRMVSDAGIKYSNLRYDFPGNSWLDNYRNRPGLTGSRKAKSGENLWRIKVDRRDLRRIWFFDYTNPDNPTLGDGQWREIPLLDIPDAIPFQERHLQYAKRVVIENGGNVTDRDAVVKELRRLLGTITNVDTDDMSREVKRLAARAYAQHLADGQTRETRLLADTPTSSEDDYYDDEPADTTDDDVAAGVSEGVARLPQPLPMDEVDEWDPFGEPDIA